MWFSEKFQFFGFLEILVCLKNPKYDEVLIMEFDLNGATYRLVANGDSYTVVDQNGFAMVAVASADVAVAKAKLQRHLDFCKSYTAGGKLQ